MSFTLFQLAAVILAVTAFASWLNAKTLKLPVAVGLLVIGLLSCAAIWTVGQLWPAGHMARDFRGFVDRIDYSKLVLDFMLGYLLFAGAMNVNVRALRRRALAVGVLATLGVCITAVIVATGFWWVASLLGYDLPFAWALVFGVLISPTDPIAVLAMTKRTSLQPELRAQIEGEALFNDGFGVVLFRAVVAFALATTVPDAAHHVNFLEIGGHVLIEALGGAALGFLLAVVAMLIMRVIDDWATETLITVALATGVYVAASAMHLSGPIGVVVAGLVMGSEWCEKAMSEQTRRYVHPFWHLIDENMNAVLFLLLGFKVFSLAFEPAFIWLAVAAAAFVLVGRWVAIAAPSIFIRFGGRKVKPSLVALLTWAGVRGGLSMAMALSLPDSPQRDLILMGTLGVVIFSMMVQSLTMEKLAVRWGYGQPKGEPAAH